MTSGSQAFANVPVSISRENREVGRGQELGFREETQGHAGMPCDIQTHFGMISKQRIYTEDT